MTSHVPQVLDTARRVVRTTIQVIVGFGSFAAVYPLIVTAIGAPAGSKAAVWLAASAVWVTGVAAALSRIMAIPAVNTFLARFRLGGHSGNVSAQDTYTTMNAIIQPGQSIEVPAGQLATGPQPRH